MHLPIVKEELAEQMMKAELEEDDFNKNVSMYSRNPVPRQCQHHIATFNFGFARPSFPIIQNSGSSLVYIHCLLNGKSTKSRMGG